MYLNFVMMKIVKKKFETNIISQAQYCRTLAIIQKIEKEIFSLRKVQNISAEDMRNYLNSLINYRDSEIKKSMNNLIKYINIYQIMNKFLKI